MSESDSLRKEIKDLQDRLKLVSRSEKLESMKTDIRMWDFAKAIDTALTSGDIDTLRKAANSLWRAANHESITPVTFDYRDHFAKYKSSGTAIMMPAEYGFKGKREIELERGLTYSIGARPGTGKSTIMCNLAFYWAFIKVTLGYKVLILTNEMKEGQLWVKLYQIYLNYVKSVRRPFMMAKDWLRYPGKFKNEYMSMQEFAEVMSKNLAIANVRKKGHEEISTVIDESVNVLGRYPDVVFMDYLQRIMKNSLFKADERLGIVDIVQAFSEKMADIDGVMFNFSQMNKDGGFKGSESPEEEAGIAWEISRDKDREGKKMPFINWEIKKSRISAYFTTTTRFDDMSGTLLHDSPNEEQPPDPAW